MPVTNLLSLTAWKRSWQVPVPLERLDRQSDGRRRDVLTLVTSFGLELKVSQIAGSRLLAWSGYDSEEWGSRKVLRGGAAGDACVRR